MFANLTRLITWSRGASFTSSPFTERISSPGSNCRKFDKLVMKYLKKIRFKSDLSHTRPTFRHKPNNNGFLAASYKSKT